MKIIKAVKKPIEIECVQWTGSNKGEIEEFCGWDNTIFYCYLCPQTKEIALKLIIKTVDGEMYAQHGDYIIKGIKGEIYPCNKEIFAETYNIVG